MWHPEKVAVFAVKSLDLRLTDGSWAFSEVYRQDIQAHWERRVAEAPSFFNGTIHLLTGFSVSSEGHFSAKFIRSDFKSFLYWRETGWPDRSVMDAFGSALIVSSEGHVLLGRQRAGNLNGGLSYPPSGFIDARDVQPDGRIDIEASVAREIFEETGLAGPEIERNGDYVVTLAGPVLSIAVRYRSKLPDAALLDATFHHISADAESELECVSFVDPNQIGSGIAMPSYAETLLTGISRAKTCAGGQPPLGA